MLKTRYIYNYGRDDTKRAKNALLEQDVRSLKGTLMQDLKILLHVLVRINDTLKI